MSRLAPFLSTVQGLRGRIYGATDLAALQKSNLVGSVSPAAYTLPLGVGGGEADAATGLYRQPIYWLDGVLLVVMVAGDAPGGKAQQQMEPLIMDTINAIAGQDVDGMIGTYRLAKGELVGLAAGVLSYQLDFAIEDQLRIVR